GLEASLDDYLRGIKGNPASQLWWSNLLYGMDPKGLNVRLSIDLYLQNRADEMMVSERGAVVLLNAKSGEILAMASHPTFNPNHLAESGADFISNPTKPLLNRATLGQYPTGSIMQPFIQSLYGDNQVSDSNLINMYKTFGFYQAPQIQLPVSPPSSETALDTMRVSPLQMALAAAALSNHGMIPAPRIAMAVNTPSEGWVSLPALGKPFEALSTSAADEAAISYLVNNQSYWQYFSQAQESGSNFTWYVGGTTPNWQATPLVIVVLLEDDNERLAKRIGQELLVNAMHP
ncbi:MAG: penicillin-binding transpeptidase domain-containing protein, partial [Chloroflexota bacterium]